LPDAVWMALCHDLIALGAPDLAVSQGSLLLFDLFEEGLAVGMDEGRIGLLALQYPVLPMADFAALGILQKRLFLFVPVHVYTVSC